MKEWDIFIQVNRACWKSLSSALRSSQNSTTWSRGDSSLLTWGGSWTLRSGEGHTLYLLGKMDGWDGRVYLIHNASTAVFRELLGQATAPADRPVQKLNQHQGIAETTETVSWEKKGYSGKLSTGLQRGQCYKGGRSLSRACVLPSVHFQLFFCCQSSNLMWAKMATKEAIPDWYRVGNGSQSSMASRRLTASQTANQGVLAVTAHQRVSVEKASEKLGEGWCSLRILIDCLYNKTSSWSIWGKSFGTHRGLMDADPCITVSCDNPLMYGSFPPGKTYEPAMEENKVSTYRWFFYPIIPSPPGWVSPAICSISISNIQQIKYNKRKKMLFYGDTRLW